MKKFTYKTNTAYIRTLKEPITKKNKWNVDRVVYLILLLLLFFWIAYFVYNKTAWVEGNGQVLMDKVDVNFTQDIRLKKLFIKEGDTVSVGENLFHYLQNTFDGDASIILKNRDNKVRALKELQAIQKESLTKKIQLSNLLERLQLISKQEKQVAKLVLLDVYTKNTLDDIIAQKLLIKNQVQLLKGELSYLENQKSTLESSSYDISAELSNAIGANYKSPIKGVVGQILKNDEEACYKSENVMTIHNIDKVYIKAYFNLKDISVVEKGREVYVELPDKTIRKGKINKVYISTYRAPSEFQKKHEPTERNILAEIIPLNKQEIPEWGKYYKLNLKVKIGKI